VIFRNFRYYSCVWIYLKAIGTQENTGGVVWHVQPSTIVCYFDFSAIFCLFSFLIRVFARFLCVGIHLEAIGSQEGTGGGVLHVQPSTMVCYSFFGHFSFIFRDFRCF